jgi:hypothetical protein
MAYSSTGFATIAASKRGNAPSVYMYSSAEAKAAVTGSGYFNSLSDTLEVGDLVIIYDSNTPTMTLSVVMSNSGGVVDLSNGTAVDVTAGS